MRKHVHKEFWEEIKEEQMTTKQQSKEDSKHIEMKQFRLENCFKRKSYSKELMGRVNLIKYLMNWRKNCNRKYSLYWDHLDLEKELNVLY